MSTNRICFTIIMCAVLGYAHGGSAEPLGIFDDHVNVGATASGEASYNSETDEYEIIASGRGFGHIAYTEIGGDVSISARLSVNASTSNQGWGAYLYVIDDLSQGDSSAIYTAWITDSGEAVAHWRDIADGPLSLSDYVSSDVQDGRLKVVRSGDSVSAYYFDVNEQHWVMFDSRTIVFPDPVYVGIGAWASSGATESTVARITEVELIAEGTSAVQSWELYR